MGATSLTVRVIVANSTRPARAFCSASIYAGLKARITPRLYGAVREGFLKTGAVSDVKGVSASSFAATLRATEIGVGCWLLPRLLLKASYGFQQTAGQTGTRSNVFGLQLVASFRQLQWGWR